MKLIDRFRNFFAPVTVSQLAFEKSRLEHQLNEKVNDYNKMDYKLTATKKEAALWKDIIFQYFMPDQLSPGQAQSLYERICPALDPEGDKLFEEAKKVWGEFNYEYWLKIDADMDNVFPSADGNIMMDYFRKYLEKVIPNYQERDDVLYTNVLVKLGILAGSYYQEVPPFPLPQMTLQELAVPENARKLYESVSIRLDPMGFKLFHSAEDILGKFDELSFYYECAIGTFEFADGFQLMKYLLVQYDHKLGAANNFVGGMSRWTLDPSHSYEICSDFRIIATPEYQEFEEKLYQNVCKKLGLVAEPAQEPAPEPDDELEM